MPAQSAYPDSQFLVRTILESRLNIHIYHGLFRERIAGHSWIHDVGARPRSWRARAFSIRLVADHERLLGFGRPDYPNLAPELANS